MKESLYHLSTSALLLTSHLDEQFGLPDADMSHEKEGKSGIHESNSPVGCVSQTSSSLGKRKCVLHNKLRLAIGTAVT